MLRDRVARWLTDWEEARKRPFRTVATGSAVVFTGMALGDYYVAGTRSVSSAAGVGAVCAVVIGLLIAGDLWPGIFQRRLTSRRPTRVWHRVWRWMFPVWCAAISLSLIAYGISVGHASVAIAGLPFMAIAVAVAVLKERF